MLYAVMMNKRGGDNEIKNLASHMVSEMTTNGKNESENVASIYLARRKAAIHMQSNQRQEPNATSELYVRIYLLLVLYRQYRYQYPFEQPGKCSRRSPNCFYGTVKLLLYMHVIFLTKPMIFHDHRNPGGSGLLVPGEITGTVP